MEPQPTALTTWLHPPIILMDTLSVNMILCLVYFKKISSLQIMTQIRTFFLNGQQYYTRYDINIANIVEYFNYNTSILVLEYNNLICNKINWSKIILKNNDKIEIVTIVGGG